MIMNKIKENIKFNIKDKVLIKDLNLYGYINIIQISLDGIVYKVDYFSNGQQHFAWLYECELIKYK